MSKKPDAVYCSLFAGDFVTFTKEATPLGYFTAISNRLIDGAEIGTPDEAQALGAEYPYGVIGDSYDPVIWGGPYEPPPGVDNTLPPTPPPGGSQLPEHPIGDRGGKFLVAIVAIGQTGQPYVIGYTVVDTSLSVGFPLPNPPPPVAGNPLPPTPQPKG